MILIRVAAFAELDGNRVISRKGEPVQVGAR